MKKLFIILPVVALLVTPLFVSAQITNTSITFISNVSTINDVYRVANSIARWFMTIVIAVSVIFFVMAGFLYVTSGGKEDNLKSAKNYLLYGIIGVGVALHAGGIQVVIVNIFSTTGGK